jgi:hypothetical protein
MKALAWALVALGLLALGTSAAYAGGPHGGAHGYRGYAPGRGYYHAPVYRHPAVIVRPTIVIDPRVVALQPWCYPAWYPPVQVWGPQFGVQYYVRPFWFSLGF